jgi:uncharacterized protein with HEPN domain
MSPSKRDWRLYADDIIEGCGKIRRYVAGMSYDGFAADDRTRDAVLRNIEVIGEAARNLPAEETSKVADIEWRKVCDMRNLVAHEYFGIDLRIVWDVATKKLDDLEKAVRILRG